MNTTKLKAINTMLRSVGEAPVDSLTTDLFQAQEAIDFLDDVTTEVLADGWCFNSDHRLTLSPNTDGEIIKPANAISLDVSTTEYDYYNYSERNGKIYDTKNHTFKIGKPLKTDIVWFYDFDQLPEVAKKYIKLCAVRRFQLTKLGAADLHNYNSEQERQAYAALQRYELLSSDPNIQADPDVAYISQRNWGGYYNT